MGWVPICDGNSNSNPFDCIAFCRCRWHPPVWTLAKMPLLLPSLSVNEPLKVLNFGVSKLGFGEWGSGLLIAPSDPLLCPPLLLHYYVKKGHYKCSVIPYGANAEKHYSRKLLTIVKQEKQNLVTLVYVVRPFKQCMQQGPLFMIDFIHIPTIPQAKLQQLLILNVNGRSG